MRRSGFVAFSVAAVAAIAPAVRPAGAQAPPVVAGPLPSGVTLAASDRGAELCLDVSGADSEDEPRCAAVPGSARHPRLQEAGRVVGGGATWYGAVTPDVAAVELRWAGGERARAATSEGPAYRGRFAGAVRFFLLAGPSSEEPYVVRMLAADGHVLAAMEPPGARLPTLRGARTFATGRAGGRRWRALALVCQTLRATPLEPERFERQTCIGLGPVFAGRLGTARPALTRDRCGASSSRPSRRGARRPASS